MTAFRFSFLAAAMLVILFARLDTVEHDGPEGLWAMYALAGLFLIVSAFIEPLYLLWSMPIGKLMLIPVIFIVLYLLAIGAIILFGLCSRSDGSEKLLIVLGTRVIDGAPSTLLRGRLDSAVEYLSAHNDACCIVSGGRMPSESCTEAEVMMNYLYSKGIDKSRIVCEPCSTSTYRNLKNSRDILNGSGADISDSLAVCTDLFHFARCCWLAHKLGYRKLRLVPSKTSPLHTASWFFREIMVFVKHTIEKPQ